MYFSLSPTTTITPSKSLSVSPDFNNSLLFICCLLLLQFPNLFLYSFLKHNWDHVTSCLKPSWYHFALKKCTLLSLAYKTRIISTLTTSPTNGIITVTAIVILLSNISSLRFQKNCLRNTAISNYSEDSHGFIPGSTIWKLSLAQTCALASLLVSFRFLLPSNLFSIQSDER